MRPSVPAGVSSGSKAVVVPGSDGNEQRCEFIPLKAEGFGLRFAPEFIELVC